MYLEPFDDPALLIGSWTFFLEAKQRTKWLPGIVYVYITYHYMIIYNNYTCLFGILLGVKQLLSCVF